MNECKKEKRGGICFYNCDNIEFMKTKPDNYYDLAIVDPPYGIGAGSKSFINRNTANKRAEKFYKDNDWDKCPPPPEYWSELKRVCKNYIVWGGNYFTDYLPPSRCYIVWDKKTGANSYADCELALTNIDGNARLFTKFWLGAHAEDDDGRIHPTQKPIDLYRFCLLNYAKQNFKLLDTHGGSSSFAIASDVEGFDLDVCEIDEKYFNDAVKRFDYHKRQLKLF
jgi:site-specific DNA-methyltransferase (adenine-specific)